MESIMHDGTIVVVEGSTRETLEAILGWLYATWMVTVDDGPKVELGSTGNYWSLLRHDRRF